MKAYPKSEKEVLCSECGKPILFKEDLFFIDKSLFHYKTLPVHIECYGKAFRKKPIHIKLSTVDEHRGFIKQNLMPAGIVFVLLLLAAPLFINNLLQEPSSYLLLFLSIFIPASLLASSLFLFTYLKSRKLKNKYERQLSSKLDEKIKI